MKSKSFRSAKVICAAAAMFSSGLLSTQSFSELTESRNASEMRAIAQEAYLYLYPLVTMDVTRKQLINSDPKTSTFAGPANVFRSIRTFPPVNAKEVVRPNFDTLYSSSWLDLTKGPVVVSNPDTSDRYFLLPMMDMWTNVFAVPGKRTSGTKAANFAVVPPGWSGELPNGIQRIEAPTPYVWIIGRTQTNGVKDYDAVRKIQDGYSIIPLQDWGRDRQAPSAPPRDNSVDVVTPPLNQVNNMKPADFFRYGAELMKIHPPHATDWSALQRFKRIGLEPGKSFDTASLDASVSKVLEGGAADAMDLLMEKSTTLARIENGWAMNTDTMGVYGNYYLKRALVAMMGLGANQVEDAVYPLAITDADGKQLIGGSKYVLRFNKSELPPVEAFWSITMYDVEGFQVQNPIDRFAIGDRDDLKFNSDGSLDIFIQSDNPGPDRESNWLPSPASGVLGITMRLYAPKAQVVNANWAPPAIKRVDN